MSAPDAPEAPGGTISIAVVEDNRLLREGLTHLLERQADLEVVECGGTGDLDTLRRLAPRVILLDMSLEHGDSLRLAGELAEELPDTGVIVMGLLPEEEDIMDFVAAGVAGFVMKDASLADLVGAIRSVAEGTDVLPPSMVATLFSEIAGVLVARGGDTSPPDNAQMTPREREVIHLIGEGLSNKAIAGGLHISPNTVKSHVRNIMEKLALNSRLQIAAWVHDKASG